MPTTALSLRVPRSDQKPLAQLLGFSQEQMKAFKDTLRGAPPKLLLRDLADRVAGTLNSDPDETYAIIQVLARLYGIRVRRGSAPEEFAEQVRLAAEAANLGAPVSGWKSFESDLAELLSFQRSLGVTSKALDVMTEHERTLCQARILSDLRPVFREKVEEGPAAAVIVHTLRIRFHSGEETAEFFVAMDGQDLAELKRLVDRAIQKDIRLRELAAKADLPCLEAETH